MGAAKVVSGVIHDLLSSDPEAVPAKIPEEYKIECACAILENVGFTLEATTQGQVLMQKFIARLMDLKRATGADGKQIAKRVQFQIQDLLDLRQNGWQKKMM